MDYTIGIKHSYRRHHYVLQSVLIMQGVQVTYMMENSSPFMGDPAPTVDRHTTTVFAGILQVITLYNALPEVCKLNPAPHLLSLSVL